MKNPKVSVVIPVYNRAHMLSGVLESVLNQSFRDFECIVVDDGSKDDPQSVVSSFNDERLVFIKHNQNKMMAEAYNTAISNAKGEYLAILESDDKWRPHKLQKQVEVLENNLEAGVCYCGMEVKNQFQEFLRNRIPKYKGNVFGQVMTKSVVASLSTLLIRKSIVDKIAGFDPWFGPAASYEYELRLAQATKFDFVESLEVDYLQHENNLSNILDSDIELQIAQHQKLLDLYQGEFKKYPHQYQIKLSSLGMNYLVVNKKSKARNIFFEAIKFAPLKITNWRNLILSFYPRVSELILKKRRQSS